MTAFSASMRKENVMKHICLVLTVIAVLSVTALLFAQPQTRQTVRQAPQVTARLSNEQLMHRTITTQQRLNRYFHNDVIPKLKSCWSLVQGSGNIQINHNYVRDEKGKWVAQELTVGKSSLPRGQEAVALRCMQQAVRGSSFPIMSDDGNEKEYVVMWNWPVPFPTNAEEQTRVMFAARGPLGAGACGGAQPNCVDCSHTGLACFDVCNGYHYCNLVGGGCQASHRCTSGSPFAVAGTAVMY
jgi:hypothetical protein